MKEKKTMKKTMQFDIDPSQEAARATTWLSHGLETLVAEHQWMADSDQLPKEGEHANFDFDIVIVGSGYGGAVAASELAACVDAKGNAPRICILERGKEYLAGMFPSRMADLAGHVRFATPKAKAAKGVRDGLFDIRVGDDAMALVANGLGGGSLINAGVMKMPQPSVFREARWPDAIRKDKTLEDLGTELQTRLGAGTVGAKLTKTQVVETLAGGMSRTGTEDKDSFKLTPITVADQDGPNAAGVHLDKCKNCGDCATGCNYNAKNSLDLNLLRLAERGGAKIYTGATVLRVEPIGADGSGWLLHVNHTDEHLRERQPKPFVLRAQHVILAAGTFGSTEILMRSRSDRFKLSAQLGRKFSINGDMIAVAHEIKPEANAVADEATLPDDRHVGPTITAMLDLRGGKKRPSLVIQDLAVPGPLRRLFEESVTTTDVLNRLVEGDRSEHKKDDWSRADEAAVNPDAMKHSLIVAMIGRDDADGELHWGRQPICDDADGLLTVRWPALRNDPRFADYHERFFEGLKDPELAGRMLNNPMWRPLSTKLENVFGRQRGPLLTVHPLGGCAMGNTVRGGVTDDCGRVFKAGDKSLTALYEGLVVLDGSIVPTSLGINPALTISVLALRAIRELKSKWKLVVPEPHPQSVPPAPADAERRPIFRMIETNLEPKPTEIELTEQLRGLVNLKTRDGGVKSFLVEITLTTEPVTLDSLMVRNAPGKGRILSVAKAIEATPATETSPGKPAIPAKGHLRILRVKPNPAIDPVTDQVEHGNEDGILLEAEISGDLRIFALEPSRRCGRTARAFWAWLNNRGLRDSAQNLLQQGQEALRMLPPPEQPHQPWLDYLGDILCLSSRAGAVRLVEYGLRIDKVKSFSQTGATLFDPADFEQQRIRGKKRLTYARSSSPWTQLMDMSLNTFPRMAPPGKDGPELKLNPRYLARQQVPLIRVVGQQDKVASMVDVLSFLLYVFRVVLQIHALSFRKPDPPLQRKVDRLPGYVPGLPAPQIDWLTVEVKDESKDKAKGPVCVRLARYDGTVKDAAPMRPVLLIHGYSASGTTFAHATVPQGLVRTLCDAGRDVWVLDMRSSSGMPTARCDWSFEEVAEEDIPVAIHHMRDVTGHPRTDVVAHCMGSAMFFMAVLAQRDVHNQPNTLHQRIGRVVLSQIGPALVLTPANTLRAYVMRYIRHFLPLEDYAFSPKGKVSLAGQLLDRFLATMPLPEDEYQLENPRWPLGKRTPWVGTRHRMDALYARDFSACNLSPEVLDYIDDFFGPLSVETVSQVIHFVAPRVITDRAGNNVYVNGHQVPDQLKFPVLSIHGENNGLSDVATLQLMRNTMEVNGVRYLNDKPNPTSFPLSHSKMSAMIGRVRPQLQIGVAAYMTWCIAGHGHQDCLIGKQAGDHCKVIADFLSP